MINPHSPCDSFSRLHVLAVLLVALLASPLFGQVEFRRGDCNNDSSVDVADAVFLLLFNFGGGQVSPTCLDACDFNDDGMTLGQVTDSIALLRYLFIGDMPSQSPGPFSCGVDPTFDQLTCGSHSACEYCPILDVSSSSSLQRDSDMAVAPSGNFIIVWEDDRDADGVFEIRVGSFNPDKTDLLDPYTVNSTSSGQQIHPAVAWNASEDFVVVWQDDSNLNGLHQIRTRGFNADGTEKIMQFTVNVGSAGQQLDPDIAMDDSGNFVIVWEDDSDSDGLYQVHARGFNATGTERWSEFTVNTGSAGQQEDAKIAMAPNGDFVIVWEDDRDSDGLFEVKGRGFDIDGTERIAQFTINSRSSGQQTDPAIAIATNGDFVVTWEDDRDGDGQYQVHARGFDALGIERFEQFTVNASSRGQQVNPTIDARSNGDFIVAWEDDGNNDGEFHIRFRGFHADGTELVAQERADCIEPAQHLAPTIAFGELGRVHIFWDETGEAAVTRVIGRTYD